MLRPFAEQLADALIAAGGDIRGRSVMVVGGDQGMLAAELRQRGAEVLEAAPPAGSSVVLVGALGTLGIAATPSAAIKELLKSCSGPMALLHMTDAAAHIAIAHAALDSVVATAADPWLLPVSAAASSEFQHTLVRDIARFDSPRQFYAALITERDSDAGLDAIERRRILESCVAQLRQFTAHDDTVRLPIEAHLLVRS